MGGIESIPSQLRESRVGCRRHVDAIVKYKLIGIGTNSGQVDTGIAAICQSKTFRGSRDR